MRRVFAMRPCCLPLVDDAFPAPRSRREAGRAAEGADEERGVAVSAPRRDLCEAHVRPGEQLLRTREASARYLRYSRLVELLFRAPNPIPVKAALAQMGLDTGELRLPLCRAEDALREELRCALGEVDLV